jgi:hypothetical protein
MSTDIQSAENTEDKEVKPSASMEIENIRLGYQTAIGLWTYQGGLNWDRFNGMLAANSIILSVIGIVLSGTSPLPVFTLVLPLIGLFLCAIWVCFAARGFAYHKYWSSQARDLEEKYLSNAIEIVQKAKSAEDSGKVTFNRFAKLGGQKEVTYIVIAVFVLVFALAFIYMLTRI